ncbi:hypothetical protein MMC12_003976 [Toensbergia leucococca]|nr:hypothetical protein [Toensbergia leucococca]
MSITLPRNFTFHYTEGEEPKTPERELIEPTPPSPHTYRIRRRPRANILPTGPQDHPRNGQRPQDIPVPTIEMPSSPGEVRPPLLQRATEPAEGYLAPVPTRHFMTAPRTPSAQRGLLDSGWRSPKQQAFGESLSRPMSACSLFSDSSEDSNGSLASPPSLGGSCTSPESDAPDPFVLSSFSKITTRYRSALASSTKTIRKSHGSKQKEKQVHWTPEMDRHLWKTYLVYLQDPTVTPFKTLPGSAPPLGVCHRVAREARRSWRGAKATSRKASEGLRSVSDEANAVSSGDSPDTIKPSRSGSITPTGSTAPKPPPWPKSGASTRRRLRELCKRKPTIAPHYQRLLQTRSPSPFSSSPRSQSQATAVSSPLHEEHRPNPFNTRNIQLSLATSTAATMQPGGPLAQLATHSTMSPPPDQDWFNDPIVPWASPAPIPSDIGLSNVTMSDAGELPRLGSPFGYHTWGPSRSRQHLRPSSPRTRSDYLSQPSHPAPSLRSPVHLHDGFPYPSVNKRRAQHQLEDELSPGGTDIRRNLLSDLFGGVTEGRHRRVRSRGFSLGDVSSNPHLSSLFTPPPAHDQTTNPDVTMTAAPDSNSLAPPSRAESIKRLGSPFNGAGTVFNPPPRGPSRHAPSASLSAYDPGTFSSIDQRLRQSGHDDEFSRR